MLALNCVLVLLCVCGGLSLPAYSPSQSSQDPMSVRLPKHARVLLPTPQTDFNCTGRRLGMYADTTSRCKVVHVCHPTLSIRGLFSKSIFSFYCSGDTVFDQSTQSCSQIDIALPCIQAPSFYEINTRLTSLFNRVVQPIKDVFRPLNPSQNVASPSITTVPPTMPYFMSNFTSFTPNSILLPSDTRIGETAVAVEDFKSNFISSVGDIKDKIINSVDSVKTNLLTNVGNIKNKVITSVDTAATSLFSGATQVKKNVIDKVESAGNSVLTSGGNIKNKFVSTVDNVATGFIFDANRIKNKLSTNTKTIKDTVLDHADAAKDLLFMTVDGVTNKVLHKLSIDGIFDTIPQDAIRASFPQTTEQEEVTTTDEGLATEDEIVAEQRTVEEELVPELRITDELEGEIFDVETTTLDVYSSLEKDSDREREATTEIDLFETTSELIVKMTEVVA